MVKRNVDAQQPRWAMDFGSPYALPILFKEVDSLTTKEKKISFENLLKYAMNHLDSDCSNIAR